MEAIPAAVDDNRSVQSDDESSRAEGERGSPPPNCSICLGRCTNMSFTNTCLHQFCFECLVTWSKEKTKCPLCKQNFKSIIHNVKSNHQYEEYPVEQRSPADDDADDDLYEDIVAATQRVTVAGPETGWEFEERTRTYPTISDISWPRPSSSSSPARAGAAPRPRRRSSPTSSGVRPESEWEFEERIRTYPTISDILGPQPSSSPAGSGVALWPRVPIAGRSLPTSSRVSQTRPETEWEFEERTRTYPTIPDISRPQPSSSSSPAGAGAVQQPRGERRRRRSTPTSSGSRVGSGSAPRPRRSSATGFRLSVYKHNLWARPLPDTTGRFRECTAEFYRSNPSEVNRLVPWLNRELQVLLNDNATLVRKVLTRILQLLPRYYISSKKFHDTLHRHLHQRTDHFQHELYVFASTPYDMTGYDRKVQHGQLATRSTVWLTNEADSQSESNDESKSGSNEGSGSESNEDSESGSNDNSESESGGDLGHRARLLSTPLWHLSMANRPCSSNSGRATNRDLSPHVTRADIERQRQMRF